MKIDFNMKSPQTIALSTNLKKKSCALQFDIFFFFNLVVKKEFYPDSVYNSHK